MPANKRPRRLNYAVNKKGPKTGTKVSKAIKHYEKLKRKEAFEGKTKWIKNAYAIITTKLKKYGINVNKI